MFGSVDRHIGGRVYAPKWGMDLPGPFLKSLSCYTPPACVVMRGLCAILAWHESVGKVSGLSIYDVGEFVH
jgi:hypothetical protein